MYVDDIRIYRRFQESHLEAELVPQKNCQESSKRTIAIIMLEWFSAILSYLFHPTRFVDEILHL